MFDALPCKAPKRAMSHQEMPENSKEIVDFIRV
jgi:hypothetical protein